MDNKILYETLYELKKDVTVFNELDELVTFLRQMDPFGLQIVSIMIQQHSERIAENKDRPFSAEIKEQKATFDIRKFDPVLQSILLELCKRHLTKVAEGSIKVEVIGE